MIRTDAAALEARYGNKTGQHQPVPTQELFAPANKVPMPQGKPVAEGEYINQNVGRGMAVVPPKSEQPNQPAMAVIPPSHANRTSMGTIVEPRPDILQKTAMPVVEEEPIKLPEATPPQPRKELDLAKEVLTHIWELGGEKGEEAQKYYERSPQTLKAWIQNPSIIPLGAIDKFLKRKPGIREDLLEELEPHFAANGNEGWSESLPNRGKTSVMVCTPLMGQPHMPYHWVCIYLAKKYELGFSVQADTAIWRSRNMLAKRFLDSGLEQSLWLDADMAAPIANPEWYRWITNSDSIPQEYTNFDVLGRLRGHGKAIVGGVYATRRYHGQLVIQPEIKPRSHEDKLLCNEIRRGTARGLAAVDWIGFGCALIHRQVFLEIQRTCADEIRPMSENAPWRFFQPVGDEGEDEAFCMRARRCGIPIWLDTQLVCPHIGNMAFLPEHTQSLAAI